MSCTNGQIYLRQILYEPYWQGMRMGMLGYWGSPEGCAANLERLARYTDAYEGSAEKQKYAIRIYRVLNLLNAVLLGTHCGDRDLVRKARDKYSLLHQHNTIAEEPWDWSIVAQQLQGERMKWLVTLRQHLIKRRKTATKRGHDPNKTRPELMVFLGLIDSEIARRGVEHSEREAV